MIRVRTDDVLVSSEAPKIKGKEFERWKRHHLWLQEAPEHFYHTPAVLVKEIQQFPECIEYLKQETAEGRLFPILHGLEHDPVNSQGKQGYGTLEREVIDQHLEQSLEWMLQTLGVTPTIWATPHGAMSTDIQMAARKFCLVAEGTSDPVIDQRPAERVVRQHGTVAPLDNKVVMVHFWEQGLKLFRIVQVAKHGNWKNAAKIHPEYFK